LDFRKELSAHNPMQAELDKLKALGTKPHLSAFTELEDVARDAAMLSCMPTAATLLEQEMERHEKLNRKLLGTDLAMAAMTGAQLGSDMRAHMEGSITNPVLMSAQSIAQAMADSEADRIKKMFSATSDFSMNDGLADALKTLETDRLHHFDTPTDVLPQYVHNLDLGRETREREDKKLELARVTADAMLETLANAKQQAADSKAEAAESRKETSKARNREWIAIMVALVFGAIGVVGAWEPVLKLLKAFNLIAE
jgi:hypothetical protein